MPLAENFRLLGVLVQTELGHGTNVNGLETTATFDPTSQEFVLHSPTLTSVKWWPAGLGKFCTHAILVAKLITKGENCGNHLFIVQFRSMEDHKLLNGEAMPSTLFWNSVCLSVYPNSYKAMTSLIN
jgi:acyl-CoA oxidase